MNKKILIMGLSLALSVFAHAQSQYVASTFQDSEDGTRSATAFIPKGSGVGNVTDLAYRLDAGSTTGTIDIRSGQSEKSITSATSSGTVLFFDNDPTEVSVAEYVIFYDDSAKAYFLYRATASATTSITIQETAPAATTSDKLYPCGDTTRRHAVAVTSETVGTANIWVPASMPSALTLDGNTTSCRISVNGVRLKD